MIGKKAFGVLCAVVISQSAAAQDAVSTIDVAAYLGAYPARDNETPLRGPDVFRERLGAEIFERDGQIYVGRFSLPGALTRGIWSRSFSSDQALRSMRVWRDSANAAVAECSDLACLETAVAQAIPGDDRVQLSSDTVGMQFRVTETAREAIWVTVENRAVQLEDGRFDPEFVDAFMVLLRGGLTFAPAEKDSQSVVTGVVPGGPADRSAVQVGQVFTTVDKLCCGYTASLSEMAETFSAGRASALGIDLDDDGFVPEDERVIVPAIDTATDGRIMAFNASVADNPFAGLETVSQLGWEARWDDMSARDKARAVTSFIVASSRWTTEPPEGTVRTVDAGCEALPRSKYRWTTTFRSWGQTTVSERDFFVMSAFDRFTKDILTRHVPSSNMERAIDNFIAAHTCRSEEFDTFVSRMLTLAPMVD